jgi:hypothetical protein
MTNSEEYDELLTSGKKRFGRVKAGRVEGGNVYLIFVVLYYR